MPGGGGGGGAPFAPGGGGGGAAASVVSVSVFSDSPNFSASVCEPAGGYKVVNRK
jgi:hypothetical protein